MPDFHGEPTRILENQLLQLEYLAASARIVRFCLKGKPNLFADLGLSPVETSFGNFYFRGGHRLWHSPESMPRTYVPDNDGAVVSEISNGVRIEMPAEPWTNIAKAIEIELNPETSQVILRHELRNDGAWAVEFAPWALTMLRLGGVAILPQPHETVDEAGLLANRRLLLWSYTRIDDPRLTLRDDFVLIHATPSLPPLKLGYFNPHGWMAYWLDGTLFVKRHDPQSDGHYPDDGCNAESYCNDKFIELESLGPLEQKAPGQMAVHTELWEIYENLDVSFLSDEIKDLVTKLSS
jgi:hypothetical protein